MLINFRKIYFTLLFLGISFLFSGQVKALTCETDTMHAGLQCRSADLKSWNKGTATTAGCNVETVCGTDDNGSFVNNCTSNTCVLSCNSGYSVCSGGSYGTYCKENPEPVSPCDEVDPCSEVCTSCVSNYTLCSGSCKATRTSGIPNCSTYNQCSVNQECTVCASTHALCSSRNTSTSSVLGQEACVLKQTCPLGQTFDPCTATCTGSLFSLKLDYDSGANVGGATIKQSYLGSSIFNISSNSRIGIGTSNPALDSLMNFYTGGTGFGLNMGMLRITNLEDPVGETDAATKAYVDSTIPNLVNPIIASSSIWQLLGSNTYYNGGNVGIGTTNPAEKLQIAGNILLPSSGYIKHAGNYLNIAPIDDSVNVLAVRGSATLGGRMEIYKGGDSTIGAYINSNGNSYFDGGNVGIGTTNPAQKLEVSSGNIKVSNGYGIYYDSSNIIKQNTSYGWDISSWQATVFSTGNVGIGTTATAAKLDVNSGTNINTALFQGNDATGNGIGLTVRNNNTTNSSFAIYQMQAGDTTHGGMFFGSRAANNAYGIANGITFRAMAGQDIGLTAAASFGALTGPSVIIKSGGAVGIGTTTPGYKLTFPNLTDPVISAGNGVIRNVSDPIFEGDVATKGYVDTLASSSPDVIGKFVGVSNAAYYGNNTIYGSGYTTSAGYNNANNVCNDSIDGSHVCTTEEILNTIRSGGAMPTESIVWIFNGPPGYVTEANDCDGRTSNRSTSFGSVWQVGPAWPNGRGMLTKCDNYNKFACCK